jgi:nitrate reductase delta subunit
MNDPALPDPSPLPRPAVGAFVLTASDHLRQELFDDLAALLSYPAPHLRPLAAAAHQRVADVHVEAGEELARFAAHVAGSSQWELEELYTRTFDLNPVCALDLGWHLYGEQYERGVFLARMRDLVWSVGLAESSELPDHLTTVLPVVGRLARREAERFVAAYLRPALARMLAGFGGQGNPYQAVLRALALLALDEIPAPPARTADAGATRPDPGAGGSR